MIGQTLLHYRLLEKVGEGGMGAVYKALDTHLDRLVAIKVLPPEKTADPDRKKRFIQEAKAASSLNHPNIVVVHDVASDGGLDFIVMEYVEGKTLDQLIGARGMRLNEALGCAVQVADGLSRAHAAGIVHRDLKPTNVIVTAEGRVKILDFGLAKLIEDVRDVAFGPTATIGLPDRPRTEEGVIMGTVAYMSPEQAEGGTVDSRSDIFSFGSLLYEMLTGRRAFHRETRMGTLAAILKEETRPVVQVNEALPPEVDQVLARCLRKDPQRRWQSMSDIRVVLQDLKEDSESGRLRAPQAAVFRRRRRPLLWAGAGLGLAALAAAVFLRIFLPKKAAPPEYEITRMTFDPGLSWAPAFSADGKMFVFVSDRGAGDNLDIWVQQIAGGPALRLTSHPAADWQPVFSPDGSKVIFRSERDGGGIYEVGALGGRERRLSERGHHPRCSPDGAWISCVDIPASLDRSLFTMWLIPAGGGEPVPFQEGFRFSGASIGSAPVWSPDGRHLIFCGRKADDPSSVDWWVAPADGGPAVRTGAMDALGLRSLIQAGFYFPDAWSGSHVYYSTGTTVEGVNIFRARIEEGSWRVAGPAERITSGSGVHFHISALLDGRLLYANVAWVSNIWSLEAEANSGRAGGSPAPISDDLLAKFDVSPSRDGSVLAYAAFGGLQKTRSEVRWKNLRRGEERIFPITGAFLGMTPRLSSDGGTLAYRDVIGGKTKTFIVASEDAAGREICESCSVLGFFPDPNFVLLREEGRKLLRLDVASGEKTLLLESRAGNILDPALSPDGRWAAFVLGKPDGRVAMVIAPIDGGADSEKDWVVLFDEGSYLGSPDWSPDGNRLYYLSERDGSCSIWTQGLDPRLKKPQGSSVEVYRSDYYRRNLNFPPGNGRLAAAADKLVFLLGESSSNIFLAAPKEE